jgi:hypothetical protein
MTRRVAIPVVTLALALAAAGCGSSTSGSGSSGSGQTRTIGLVHGVVGFAAHAGLAFGDFKLFIYNPYRQHELGLSHPFNDAKALAAALFAYHEVKEAAADIRDNRTLSHLFAPLTALAGSFALLRHDITSGSGISAVNAKISSLLAQAAGAGVPVRAATSGFNF